MGVCFGKSTYFDQLKGSNGNKILKDDLFAI